jgi:hypothetical protein
MRYFADAAEICGGIQTFNLQSNYFRENKYNPSLLMKMVLNRTK